MRLIGLNVVVVGGGVAGLAAAAALLRRGARVTLLEQAAGFLEVGAGIQISPNGARVIRALGQGDALAQAALRGDAVVLRSARHGAEVVRLKLPDTGPGFHLFHRADLVALLEQGCVGLERRFAAHVVSANAHGPRPSVTLANGESIEGDLLIGAEGLHSVLRGELNPKTPRAPFFTGQVAWRALVPCTPDASREVQVFMGPGRHLVSYPLRGGSLRNIVAVEERKDWAAEGWHHPDNPENLRTAFAGFGGRVPDWLAQVETPYVWGLFRHAVAQNWHTSHAALLGDAAHPTLPFMAQGANMALEDAWTLAAMLEAAPTMAEGLAAYQSARHERVVRVVKAANRNARNYHLRTPVAQVAHQLLRISGRLVPNAPLRQFSWIYDHDVTET